MHRVNAYNLLKESKLNVGERRNDLHTFTPELLQEIDLQSFSKYA